MLVGERMSQPVITAAPNLPVVEALNLMKRSRIRRLPVVRDGCLVGIVSDKDLLNASPSPAVGLNVWEISHRLTTIQIKDVMTRHVLCVSEDTPIEQAARLMVDNKIGGLPVMEGERLIGIITETDLFKILLELMGAREQGVRVTALVHDEPGLLARLTRAVFEAGGSFRAFGQFAGEGPANRMVTFKVSGVDEDTLHALIQPLVERILDLRPCCD
jgi:acetoin utilization protein AcuB